MQAISEIAVYWAVRDGVPIDARVEWFDVRLGMVCWTARGEVEMASPKRKVYELRLTDEEVVELLGCVRCDMIVTENDRDAARRVAPTDDGYRAECTAALRRLRKIRRQLEAQMNQARVGMD